MNPTFKQNFRALQENSPYALFLGLSLAFFSYKGLQYLFLGSFVPLLLITIILFLFFWSLRRSDKALKRVLTLWGILLLLWSGARLLLTVLNTFLKPLNEAHVNEQLTDWGLLQSCFFVIAAIYLLRCKKKISPTE